MQPSLCPGQLVVLRRKRRLRCGDIVMLQHDGREKLKRIHQLRPKYVYVRGDNSHMSTDSDDFGWLPDSAVIAVLAWPRR